MRDYEPLRVTVQFDMEALTILPQLAGMTDPHQVAAKVQEDFENFSVLMDHMADYHLNIKVEPLK